MPSNHDQLEHLRKMISLMRRLSVEHTAADNPLIGAKLSEVATDLEKRAMTLEHISAEGF